MKGVSTMWKWLKETILAIVVVVLTTAGAAAAAPSLSDGAHLLTPAEQAEVTAVLQDTEARYGVRVAVVTVASTKGVKAGTYANQLLDRDYKDGQNGNMVLLLAMDRHDWYVATDKAMKEKISNKKGIPYLKDAFLPALKDGHYAKAFEAYGQSSAKLLAYYQEKGKAYDPADAFSPLALVVALVLAVGGGVAFRAHLISRMSNVRQAAAADAYVDASSFHLTDSSDTFVFMTVQHIAKARPADDDLPDFDSDADCSDDDHGGGGGSF